MKWTTKANLTGWKGDTLVLFVAEKADAPEGDAGAKVKTSVADAVRTTGFDGKVGSTAVHPGPRPDSKFILAGIGKAGDIRAETIRRAAGAAALRARATRAESVAFLLPHAEADLAAAIVEGAERALYRFTKYLTTKPDADPKDALIAGDGGKETGDAVGRALVFCEANALARDLVNEPPSVHTPKFLADAATAVARASKGAVRIEVWDEKRIEKEGMGALRGVSLGSSQPPRFVHMTYAPKKSVKSFAFVGKGITFDSGGLGLKDDDGMLDMKYDMSGAAAVIGVMSALSRLKPSVTVHGIFAATENMPGPSAYKFRDVLKTFGGKTIEVTHTDAEGRLVLADALGYACKLKPDEIVDCATLTGAIRISLGTDVAGVFGTDDDLIQELVTASEREGEPMWHMPIVEDYFPMLKSDVADIKNTTGQRPGGSITASLFLREFVDRSIPWAHIDIAGSAMNEKARPWLPVGPTGTLVRTILRYLLSTGER